MMGYCDGARDPSMQGGTYAVARGHGSREDT